MIRICTTLLIVRYRGSPLKCFDVHSPITVRLWHVETIKEHGMRITGGTNGTLGTGELLWQGTFLWRLHNEWRSKTFLILCCQWNWEMISKFQLLKHKNNLWVSSNWLEGMQRNRTYLTTYNLSCLLTAFFFWGAIQIHVFWGTQTQLLRYVSELGQLSPVPGMWHFSGSVGRTNHVGTAGYMKQFHLHRNIYRSIMSVLTYR